MSKRVFSIFFIYLCTAIAWVALGTTVDQRTHESDRKLRGAVGELWGTVQKQQPPTICGSEGPSRGELIPLQASNITADLNLEPRQKGLLWYSTYRVHFGGRYQIANPTDAPQPVTFTFVLPSQKAVYDDVRFVVGGKEVEDLPVKNGVLTKTFSMAPGQSESVEVRYATTGMDAWWYDFGSCVNQVKNFSLTMTTNFDKIDFPESSISPTSKEKTSTGWKMHWAYTNLFSSVKIGMAMPHKLNPGPWVSQVSFAAPVSLFLFMFLLFIISTARQITIHPMNYFFIGASFFSFHLLLAYLVDHVSVHLSFFIASVVSVALVVSYMTIVVGQRFALLEVGISQFVFLVLFSYSFFFQGYTGLAITILCVATLFVTMQITAHLDWDKVFGNGNPRPEGGKVGEALNG
jgi:hypothetical protein